MATTAKTLGTNIVYNNNTGYNVHPEYLLNFDTSQYIVGRGKVTIINGFAFPSIPSNAVVTGYNLYYYFSNTTTKKLYLVTGMTQGSSTYTAITPEIQFTGDGNVAKHEHVIAINDANDAGVVWMNNNLNAIRTGTDFGVRLTLTSSDSFYYFAIEIVYTVPPSSSIYVGGSQVSEVYVGGTKATAVYIGSTRVL